MKLLDTTGGNTKLKKSASQSQYLPDLVVRIAGLSMAPDDILCPSRHIAECAGPCINGSGRGSFPNVQAARKAKSDWYHSDRSGFIDQLKKELTNFSKLCTRTAVVGYVRLNVFSDIPWELSRNGSIPQAFPELEFFDYTKLAVRLGTRYYKMPRNYQLMFSYSAGPKYAKQVKLAMKSPAPMSVVFDGPMPDIFMGRKVINGDESDINNLRHRGAIVGLRFKQNRIAPVDPRKSALIINTREVI